MSRFWSRAAISSVAVAIALAACDRTPTSPAPEVPEYEYNFREGPHGWTFAGAGYYKESNVSLTGDYRPLAGTLAAQGAALFAEGSSIGTIPVMFFKSLVSGLVASQRYNVSFALEIATNTPYGCAGAGSSPGEGTYVKAGASTSEPSIVEVPTSSGYVFIGMDFDLGNRANAGSNSVTLGHIANSRPCPDYSVWELKALQSDATVEVSADANGRAWIFQAVDPGFEGGVIRVYFTQFNATFQQKK
jgi:hypothetical protein